MEGDYTGSVCIPITQGRHVLIDAEDYDRLRDHPICFTARFTKRGKQRAGYACVSIKGRSVRLHSFLLEAPPGLLHDHINRNSLDNRKRNIRFCSKAQNNWNRSPVTSPCTSRWKGVSLLRKSGKWRARIEIRGVRHTIGIFRDEADAALAYNFAAAEHFGEYAAFNTAAA